MERWPRVIAHADMDAFYASIEQLDDPALRGKPLLVGPNSNRGVVLTASYEARPAGVGSAMPMALARRRCPEALIVPPRFERYREVSRTVMDVFADFSPAVEALSLDEAFLDMTGSAHIFGPPRVFARKLKDAVAERTGGLTVSVGVSGSKYVAKVASSYGKPDGLTVVAPESARDWLAPQPVGVLWGAGPKLQAKLAALGLHTVGQVAAADPHGLTAALGKVGLQLHALARAEDPRPVEAGRAARSLSSEQTLEVDVRSRDEIRFHLRQAAEKVARRLRKQGYLARGVRLKLKRSDFRLLTRQAMLAEPSQSVERLWQASVALLNELDDTGPFRLVGVGAFDLAPAEEAVQLDLLSGTAARAQRLEAALDAVEDRFGPGAVHRAREELRPAVVRADTSLDFLKVPGKKTKD
jgi:DNA polymerase-4